MNSKAASSKQPAKQVPAVRRRNHHLLVSTKTIESRTSQKIQNEERVFFENLLNNRKREKLSKFDQDSLQLKAKMSKLASRDAIHQIGNLIDSHDRLPLGELINKFDDLYQHYWRDGAEALPNLDQETPESMVQTAKTQRDRYMSKENLLNYSLLKKPPRSDSVDGQTIEHTLHQDYTSQYFSSRYGTQNRLTKNESTIGALVIHLESLVELGESILKKAAEGKVKTFGREKARDVVISRLLSDISYKVTLLKVELEVKNSQLLVNTDRAYSKPNSRLYRTAEKQVPMERESSESPEYRFKTDRKASASEVEEIVARLYKVKRPVGLQETPENKKQPAKVQQYRPRQPAAVGPAKPGNRSFEKETAFRQAPYFPAHVSEKSFEETESEEESEKQQSPPETSKSSKPIERLRAVVDRIRNKQTAIERTGKDIRQSICVTDPSALFQQLDKISSDFTMLKKTKGMTAG